MMQVFSETKDELSESLIFSVVAEDRTRRTFADLLESSCRLDGPCEQNEIFSRFRCGSKRVNRRIRSWKQSGELKSLKMFLLLISFLLLSG